MKELKNELFMTKIGVKIVFLSILSLHSLFLFSQDDIYRAEIGVESGGGWYLGDVNSVARFDLLLKNTKNIQPNFGVGLRYKINSRIAFWLGYNYIGIKGKYKYAYGKQIAVEEINNSIYSFDLWGEYNFYNLNGNKYKHFSKRISPFIFLGLGNVFMPNGIKEGLNPQFIVPFGVGVKFKLKERWNFNIKWVNRLLLADDLEGIKKWDNPLPKTVSNRMNNDMHTALSISFTYDFWEKSCNCNNQKRKKKRKK